MDRNKVIIKTSILGIIVNIILVVFKAIIGIIANSIAITLDAVNNLTDALSSVITIVGTKLSNKAPDKKHPYGHGRIEYFTSLIISAIVLFAGITAGKESIIKIISPEESDYSIVALIIIAVAVVVKFVFGKYVKKVGKKVNSRKPSCIWARCFYGLNSFIHNFNCSSNKLHMEFKFRRIFRSCYSSCDYKISN